MAYFSNGTAGEVFDAQCMKCKYGQKRCPILSVQYRYNYDAVNNATATAILDKLVKNNGTCMMYAMDPEGFSEQRQSEKLF